MDIGRAVVDARLKVVAGLAARFGDLDLAQDAFAEAAAAAVSAWRSEPPRDAAAWLWRAALRKGLDARRRAGVRSRAVHDRPEPEPTPEEALMAAQAPIPDERLSLIFASCHPALAAEARIALTLKVVCGLSSGAIARAFLTPEPTILQRITRAKKKIAAAGVRFEVPAREAWAERLEAVLATVEIAYALAYEDAALAGEGAVFAGEAMRLTGVLAALLPDEPEVLGLAALVRLAEARRPARLDAGGAMVPLAEQVVEEWDAVQIGQAARLLDRAAAMRRTGPRQVLAAIHAAHVSRLQTGVTPWREIATLYEALAVLRPGPISAVNRAVAIGHADGAQAGLAALEASERLEAWLPWQVARAWLSAQAGRPEAAKDAYRAALALGPAPAERLHLERRLAELP